ncbi:MAG: SDR family NAD(P)-dependent oxidoreductase, partial [Gimesia chilikensis]
MKTVLITGASAGFGKLVAEKLLAKGYTVYAAARRVERMQDLEAKGAHVMHMDVTDNESVKAGVGRVLEEQQRIDVLFNNAG